jgi:hypothetical protein
MLPFWNLRFLIELTNRYSSSSLCSWERLLLLERMFRLSLERWRLLQRVMGIAIAETNVPAVAGMQLLKVREHKAGSRRMKSLIMLDGHLAHPTGMYWIDTLPATDLTNIKMTAPVRPDIMTTGKSISTIKTVSQATVILAHGIIVRSQKARTIMVENWVADHNGAGILLETKRAMICNGSTAVS